MKLHIHPWVAAALVLCLSTAPAVAQNTDCEEISLQEQSTPQEAQVAFDKLRHNHCLGDHPNCRPDLLGTEILIDGRNLCVAVSAWQRGEVKDVSSAGGIIDALVGSLESVQTLPGIVDIYRRLLAEMTDKRNTLFLAQSADDLPISDWDMDIVMFDSEPERRIDFLSTLRSECGTSAACPAALEDIAALYSHGQLFERILNSLLEDRREATINQLELVDTMWTSVRTSARGLYPWEIWFNDELIDVDEIDIFAPPPDHQFILVHPGAGYEYSDQYCDAEPLFEAAVLEIAGFYRWSYTPEGKLHRPWGGSLVATWRNNSADENLGFGLMAHLPRNWSLGVTYRDPDEYSLVLGVDAAKWLTHPGRWQEALRGKLLE